MFSASKKVLPETTLEVWRGNGGVMGLEVQVSRVG